MNLPEDIIVFQILSRLPAKSVIKFKCVCRSWHSLLSDQMFISKHADNTRNQTHLLISCRNNATSKNVISMSTDSTLQSFINHALPPPCSDKFSRVRLIGPCNGIICLYGYPDDIVLCNPSIREFRVLPRSQVPRPEDGNVRGSDVGLGFDHVTNDYKVVQILFFVSPHQGCQYLVEIYSLKTNSWKKFDANSVPAVVMNTNLWSTVYRNRTFCWWAQRDDQSEVILSFDFAEEAFHETLLPLKIENLGGSMRTTRAIMPFGDDSVAVVVYKIKEVEKVFDIWVVNELGPRVGESSWTRLSRIGPVAGIQRPLGFWKTGEFILENCSMELVLLDVETGRIRNLGLYGKRDRLEVVVYYDSLVSLKNLECC